MRIETFTPRDLWRIIARGKRTVFVCWVAVIFFVVLGTYLVSPTYEAFSKIIVKRAGEDITLISGGSGNTPSVGGTEEVNTEVEIIRSRPVLEGALKLLQGQGGPKKKLSVWESLTASAGRILSGILTTLGLKDRLSEQEAALVKLEKKVFVKPQVESGVIRIVAQDEDPVQASRIANAVTDRYIEYHSKVYQGGGASQFFRDRVGEAETRLAVLEDSLRHFKETRGIISAAEQTKNLVDKLTSYDTALTDVQKRIIGEEARIKMMREQMVRHPEIPIPTLDVSNMPTIADLQTKLLNLQHDRNLLLAKFTEDYGGVRTLEEQIESTRKALRAEVERMIDLREATLNSLRVERRALESTIGGIRGEMKAIPQEEMVIDRLTRAVDDARNIHSLLLQREAEAAISESSDKRVVNIRVIAQAFPPPRPTSPNRLLNVILAPLLGLIVGVAAVFVREFVRQWNSAP